MDTSDLSEGSMPSSPSENSYYSDVSHNTEQTLDSGIGSVNQDMFQGLFRERVMKENDLFVEKMQGYINWFESDPTHRNWPTKYKKNKSSYRSLLRKFEYDSTEKVLYKKKKSGPDGIGKYLILNYIFHFPKGIYCAYLCVL